jgi:threonine dehydrogenase-like Zn-dependent dehydrogenase
VRAAVLEGPMRLVVRQLPAPTLAVGEVLVRVERAGVCGSDLALFTGTRHIAYPLIMGHEAVGRIADPGDSQHTTGTRVVIEPNIPCGTCAVCHRKRGNVCPSKRSLGLNRAGTFATSVAVPAEFAHALAPDMSLQDAVGIEPLAVALHAFRAGQVRGQVRPADMVAELVEGLDALPGALAAVADGGSVRKTVIDIAAEMAQ